MREKLTFWNTTLPRHNLDTAISIHFFIKSLFVKDFPSAAISLQISKLILDNIEFNVLTTLKNLCFLSRNFIKLTAVSCEFSLALFLCFLYKAPPPALYSSETNTVSWHTKTDVTEKNEKILICSISVPDFMFLFFSLIV